MGYRCTWIASHFGTMPRATLKLRLTRDQRIDEAIYDPGLYGLQIAEWYLVFADGSNYMNLLCEEDAIRCSDTGAVWFFFTDDTPMRTRLAAYAEGELLWSVSYDSDNGVVKTQGHPPSEIEQEVSRLSRKEQPDSEYEVDFLYEITANLGSDLLGFRHDKTLTEAKHLPVYSLKPRTE